MALMSQVQIIKSLLYPLVRYLPFVLGISASLGYFRHVYCQSNFLLTNINMIEGGTSDNLSILFNFYKAVQHAIHHMLFGNKDFERQVRAATIMGIPVIDILKKHANSGIDCI